MFDDHLTPSRALAAGALIGAALALFTPSPIRAQGFDMPDPPPAPRRVPPRKPTRAPGGQVDGPRLRPSAGHAPAPKRADTAADAGASVPDHDDLGVPQLDAARWCARITDKLTTVQCTLAEQQQAEFARIFWEGLTDAGKRHCLERLRRLGPEAATYQSLAACVRTQLAREDSGTP